MLIEPLNIFQIEEVFSYKRMLKARLLPLDISHLPFILTLSPQQLILVFFIPLVGTGPLSYDLLILHHHYGSLKDPISKTVLHLEYV